MLKWACPQNHTVTNIIKEIETEVCSNNPAQAFLDRLDTQGNLELLFDSIPNIYFWLKNHRFEFMYGNRAVVELCGCKHMDELVGKTDFAFFPSKLSINFQKDDLAIIQTGKMLHNRIEIIPGFDGQVDWYSTNKIPLYAKDGSIIGIAGTTRKTKSEYLIDSSNMDINMPEIIKYMKNPGSKAINIKIMAKMCGFSVSQFEKKFKKMFQISPLKFIIYSRVKSACQMLIESNTPISTISHSVGFYDHSTFTQQFRACIGMTPSEYRQKYSRLTTYQD